MVGADPAWADLVDGIEVGNVTIRLARSVERRRVRELADSVVIEDELEPIYAAVGSSGRLLALLSRGRVHEVAARAYSATSTERLIRDLSLILVAVQDGRVMGVAVVGCPTRLMDGASPGLSAVVWRYLVRLHVLCVDESRRGRGIGRALVDVVARFYDGLGMAGIYGACSPELASFYRACGFAVSDPGTPVSIHAQAPVLEFVQSEPAACTLIRRMGIVDANRLVADLPWIPVGALASGEILPDGQMAVQETPRGLTALMMVRGADPSLQRLQNQGDALVVRIESDRIHLCRNDATLSAAESAVVTFDTFDDDFGLWVAVAREAGSCALQLVNRFPQNAAELASLAEASGPVVVTARVDDGWEHTGSAEAQLTRRAYRPDPAPTTSRWQALLGRLFRKASPSRSTE